MLRPLDDRELRSAVLVATLKLPMAESKPPYVQILPQAVAILAGGRRGAAA